MPQARSSPQPAFFCFRYTSTLVALLVAGCGAFNVSNHPADLPVLYRNPEFNFSFYLPVSWRGYSTLVEQWEAPTYSADTYDVVGLEHGPIIVLRHPQWKSNDVWQDIPILVFTRSQWDAEHQGRFFPYAGGVIYELSHGHKYVFGIYSRFNADDSPKGWKEATDLVERSLTANALHLYPE